MDSLCRADILRATAKLFCEAFVSGSLPPNEMLCRFFSAEPRIIEHGPEWARTRLPFIGHLFRGRRAQHDAGGTCAETCDDYFDLLGTTMSLQAHSDTLPSESGYVVDPSATYSVDQRVGVVMVRCQALLANVKTERSWNENFILVLSGFDEAGKIGLLEIWADNLSAWDGSFTSASSCR